MLKMIAISAFSAVLTFLPVKLAFAADSIETAGASASLTTNTTMSSWGWVAIAIFVTGYILITLEHKFSTHKSAIALLLGGMLWITASLAGFDAHILEEALFEAGAEIFEIVVFLLAAMGLVEILVHYQFFDFIRLKLLKLKLKDKPQFLVISLITFFLSSVLNNLTVTIVMIQISRRFFKGKNLLLVASGIIVMSNAGGAWSPIGDVTTLMIWLAGKVTAGQLITQAFIPSLVLGMVTTYLLYRQMTADTPDIQEEKVQITNDEKLIIGLSLVSFVLPLGMHAMGIRPYMGLVLGLGLVWAAIEFFKARSERTTHLEANIDQILQKTDISSLKFFIGILLSVSALKVIGVLDYLSKIVFGANQEFTRVAIANVVMGMLSAIVDNVPLTALSLDVINMTNHHIWVLLAITVGTGGSLLIIGSVSGIIAMGMIKELTFDKYFKLAFIPVLAGYVAGIAVWFAQYQIIG